MPGGQRQGTFEVGARPGGDTVVEWRVPLGDSPAPI